MVNIFITNYPIDFDNEVRKLHFKPAYNGEQKGRVYINDMQYFNDVPQASREFYMRGNRPAQN